MTEKDSPHSYNSEDHRGTPADPGRVVTLIPDSYWNEAPPTESEGYELWQRSRDEALSRQTSDGKTGQVWGVVYHFIPAKRPEVMEYLGVREINGYTTDKVLFHPSDGSSAFLASVYIGTAGNPQFLGPQDPQELARKIVESSGPSGPNLEYLLNLQTALNGVSSSSRDDHIDDLVRRTKRLMDSDI